jgi:hypothetical protein
LKSKRPGKARCPMLSGKNQWQSVEGCATITIWEFAHSIA